MGNRMLNIWRQSLCLIFVFVFLSSAMAKAEPSDAVASDPNVMGWMQGFPPADDRIIGYPASDYFSFPKLRWTFCHFREIQATRRVGRHSSRLSGEVRRYSRFVRAPPTSGPRSERRTARSGTATACARASPVMSMSPEMVVVVLPEVMISVVVREVKVVTEEIVVVVDME